MFHSTLIFFEAAKLEISSGRERRMKERVGIMVVYL